MLPNVWDPVGARVLASKGYPAVTALQVVTHTTHHRGQVMTRLRELGGAPPVVDYVIWVWSGSPIAEWDRPAGQTS